MHANDLDLLPIDKRKRYESRGKRYYHIVWANVGVIMNHFFLKNKTWTWYFTSAPQYYLFAMNSWKKFFEEKMDYESLWLERLIGPYVHADASFERDN